MMILIKWLMKTGLWIVLVLTTLVGMTHLYTMFLTGYLGVWVVPESYMLWLIFISAVVVSLCGFALYAHVFQKIAIKDMLWLLFFLVLTQGLTLLYRHLHLLWFHTPLSANDYGHIQTGVYLRTQPRVLLSFVCYIVLLAPLVEEILFRGLFDKWVMGKRFMPIGLMISSIFFSLIHAQTNWLTFVFYMLLGACFFGAYKRRDSVVEAVIVHSLYNVITMIYLGFTYVL